MIKRYFLNDRLYPDPSVVSDFGESLVDLSSYRPDSSTIRDKLLSQALGSAGVGVYDFKDGKIPSFVDSEAFRKILLLKRKDLDITDVESIRKSLQIEVQSDVDKAKFEQILNDIDSKSVKADSSDSTSDSSDSSDSSN